MKKRIAGVLLTILILGGASIAHAAPQRLPIKDSNKKAKEHLAASQIRSINLGSIEDPSAQKAIREILNYLGLKAQN